MKRPQFAHFPLHFLLVFVLGLATNQFANGVDSTFGPRIQTSVYRSKGVSSLTGLPDGKIIAEGIFNTYNDRSTGALIRLNADGSLDTSFNNDLIVPGAGVSSVTVQSDGKILIAGTFTLSDGSVYSNAIVRLTTNGLLDTSFHFDPLGNLSQVETDPNGRILISGSLRVNQKGVQIQKSVVRLFDDGSIDPTFDASYIVSFRRFAMQDDRIIYNVGSDQQSLVRRLNENGSPDPSFTATGFGNSDWADLKIQSDSKILVMTSASSLMRLGADGGVDPSFGQVDFAGQSSKINLQSDDRIVVAFQSNGNDSTKWRIVRLLPNGVADQSFTPYDYNGALLRAQAFQVGDRFLLGDSYEIPTSQNRFNRLLTDGLPDNDFNIGGTGFQWINPGKIQTVCPLTNGKVMLAGDFDRVNNVPQSKMTRLNDDGTVDTSFQINTNHAGNYFAQILGAYDVAAQPDGKLVISGAFTYYVNGIQKANVVRLNTDGSIDPSFILSLPISDWYGPSFLGTNKPLITGDGKVLIGSTHVVNDTMATPLLLNSSGAKETSFSPTICVLYSMCTIFDIAIQPDGKILIGGKFSDGNISQPVRNGYLARLNADGTTDSSFQMFESSQTELSSLTVLPNGQILSSVRTSSLSTVMLHNSDGTPDSTFIVGSGANGKINAVAALPNGKILVGGLFTSYNGQPRRNLALLNANGTLDDNLGEPNGEVLCVTVDQQGRVLIGGQFTTIFSGSQQFSVSYVARLSVTAQPVARVPFDFDGDGKTDIGITRSNAGAKEWWLSRSSDSNVFSTVFGVDSDISAPADFTGDGKTDIAVFRPSNGNWFVLRSDDFTYLAFPFGSNGDIPMPADFDGDGKADPAVFRPSTSTWFIDRSSDGQTIIAQFGAAGDQPVAADYDGDGKADIAIYRLNNGAEEWWIQRSSAGLFATVFGVAGDKAVQGDYTGDGKADIAVWRPSNGNWFILRSEDFSFLAFPWGAIGDIPAPGDYDGDGKFDAAVFRQSTATWFVNRTGGSGPLITNFGAATDNPVAGVFVR
jgi:uncharacterized delta-60 repeat protein